MVQVARQHVLRDVLELYTSDPSILGQRLVVRFDDEVGEDAGGLTKDLFSTFWEAAFKEYFLGDSIYVPFLPIHRLADSEVYQTLGRILTHAAALTGTIPIRLSRSSIFAIVNGKPCDDETMLIDDLLLYLTPFERQVTKAALHDFRSLPKRHVDHLTEMFMRFNLTVLPTPETFRQNVVNLAKNEIAVKPLFLCCQMRSSIPDQHMEAFWKSLTIDDINSLYCSLKPTPDRVVDVITSENEDLRPHEQNVFYYLKDFVYSCNADDLVLFLQFVTGSDVLPSDGITVSFNNRTGILRVPVAHTCGNVIELSTAYTSIQEFKRELYSVLLDPNSFQMTLA